MAQPPTLLLLFGAPAALSFTPPVPLSRPRLRDRPTIHGDQWQPLLSTPPSTPDRFHPQHVRMSEAGSSSDDGTEVQLSAFRRNACVAALLALFTVNQWSRSLVFYVVDFSDKSQLSADALAEASRLFINVDLNFDQAQYGLLASLGFAALFSLTSLLAGRAVDKLDSRWLLAGAGAVWSLAMEWQAVAMRFDDVLGARLLQGFSQAFCNPAAYVALGKITPPESRSTVFGVYSSGVYLGGALAALSILIDASLGWRGLSEVTCVVGLAVALLTAVVLPPLPPVRSADAPSDAQGDAGAAERDSPRDGARSSEREWETKGKGSGGAVARDGSFAESVGELLESEAVLWILLGSTLR
jgi:MFS family permease